METAADVSSGGSSAATPGVAPRPVSVSALRELIAAALVQTDCVSAGASGSVVGLPVLPLISIIAEYAFLVPITVRTWFGGPKRSGFVDGTADAAIFHTPNAGVLWRSSQLGRLLARANEKPPAGEFFVCCDMLNSRVRLIRRDTGEVCTIAGAMTQSNNVSNAGVGALYGEFKHTQMSTPCPALKTVLNCPVCIAVHPPTNDLLVLETGHFCGDAVSWLRPVPASATDAKTGLELKDIRFEIEHIAGNHLRWDAAGENILPPCDGVGTEARLDNCCSIVVSRDGQHVLIAENRPSGCGRLRAIHLPTRRVTTYDTGSAKLSRFFFATYANATRLPPEQWLDAERSGDITRFDRFIYLCSTDEAGGSGLLLYDTTTRELSPIMIDYRIFELYGHSFHVDFIQPERIYPITPTRLFVTTDAGFYAVTIDLGARTGQAMLLAGHDSLRAKHADGSAYDCRFFWVSKGDIECSKTGNDQFVVCDSSNHAIRILSGSLIASVMAFESPEPEATAAARAVAHISDIKPEPGVVYGRRYSSDDDNAEGDGEGEGDADDDVDDTSGRVPTSDE